MLGKLGQRALELAVLFFALYAFAFLPLGQRTGLEHLRRVLETPAAREAGRDLVNAAGRLKDRLLSDEEPIRGRGTPEVPTLPPVRQLRGPGAPPANAAFTLPGATERPDASQ